MDQGFIDLRQNRSEAGPDGSFWPSFTDIMTVVVMIFIIASTALIARNWELVAELRASLTAEQQALTAATAATETSRDLQGRLSELQNTLTETRVHNLRLTEERELLQAQLARMRQQLLATGSERDRLAGELELSHREAALLGDEIAQLKGDYRELERDSQLRSARLDEALASLAQLKQQHQATLDELGTIRQERVAAREQLYLLQSEFSILDRKYQKLIQPARSAEGKQVVEVRYRRGASEPMIELRQPGDGGFRALSSGDLHRQLASLKARYGQDLYVKIIIPPESSLSYNEAWDFTRNLLHKYDYYYQN